MTATDFDFSQIDSTLFVAKLDRELGISKAGRGERRSLLVGLSWLWLAS